jgi:hypothetical protein
MTSGCWANGGIQLTWGGPSTGEFAAIRIEQCDATRQIREAWGTRKALGYV